MAEEVIVMIQARMGSTRLPGKVLLPLGSSSVLEQVIERVSFAKKIDEAIVLTTMMRDDLEIVKRCTERNIRVYCGSEDDVLDRYYQAAKILKCKHIVRITADCPLIDPDVIDIVVNQHKSLEADYTSNIMVETFPDGLDVEVFTYSALQKAWECAMKKSEREHVTLFIRNNPDQFKIVSVENDENWGSFRWTLDEEKDYTFITNVYNELKNKKEFNRFDVYRLIKENVFLTNINQGIIRNEGLLKSLKEEEGK